MNKNFDQLFNEMAAKPSVVAHRKSEFEANLYRFINLPYLTDLLIKEGLSAQPYILFGMTLEGYVVHGTGVNFFVANGYPPEGMNFFSRNHDGYCKIIMSRCLEVKFNSCRQFHLEPVCSDEDVLEREKMEKLFDKIAENNGWDMHGIFCLAKLKIKNYPDSVCWCQIFEDETNSKIYILADIDSGCIWIVPSADVLNVTLIEDNKQTLSTPFSAYLYNGKRLLRDEHSRSNGGVGVFFG